MGRVESGQEAQDIEGFPNFFAVLRDVQDTNTPLEGRAHCSKHPQEKKKGSDMSAGSFFSKFASMLLKKRPAVRKRLARSKRRVLFESLESRRVMAADFALFEFGLKNGELFGIRSIDESQVPAAERVVDFAGSQLRIDLADLDDASVRGKLTANDPASPMLYTFELEGMEWDFRESQGKLELVGDDNDLLQNEDMPLDTNGNGSVEPLDVLNVINYINSSPTLVAPTRMGSALTQSFVDVSGNDVVSPLDALLVINQLNSGADDSKIPLIAEDDFFERNLPATATEFPASEIDVLANDTGQELRLVDTQFGNIGAVEIVEASDGSGRMVIRYTPGSQFRNLDAFQYTVEDAAGNRATATVRVGYNLESTGDTSFQVNVAERVTGSESGAPIAFQDADGKALISLEYGGDENVMVGVLLSIQPNDAPFGLASAGTFASDTELENRFFSQANGFAWVTGTLAEVNEILAGLRFEPAPGFSAPDGISVNVAAFLYGSLRVSTQFSSGTLLLEVPKLAESPIAEGDFFQFDRPSEPVRLNVLANDSSPSSSSLRLVGVSQYSGVDEQSITTPFGSIIEIDPETNEIVLTPGFGPYESFVYIVSDAEGRISQGKVAVSLIDFETEPLNPLKLFR